MVKNERIIKDIDPVLGVTPKQLHEHCSAIVRTIPASLYLDDEEVQTAVNDAVINLVKKMDAGILDKFNYMDFRSYMFRTLTNMVYAHNNKKKYKRNAIFEKPSPIEDVQEAFSISPYTAMDTRDDKQVLAELISKLPKEKQRFLKFYMENDFSMEECYRQWEGEKIHLGSLVFQLKKMYKNHKFDEMFPRSEYYSQTEVTKLFDINAKQVKELILDRQIPVVNKVIQLGTYCVTTVYIKKEHIDQLNLPAKYTIKKSPKKKVLNPPTQK